MSVCPDVSELRFYGCCHPCFSLNVYLKDLSRVPLEGLVQSNGRDDWFPLLVGEMGEGRLSAFLLPFSTLTQLSKQYGKGWVNGE